MKTKLPFFKIKTTVAVSFLLLLFFHTGSFAQTTYVLPEACDTCPNVVSLDNCAAPTTAGTLKDGNAASGVSFTINYTGGNGRAYTGETVTSTGVTGLTATLAAGTLATGAGTVTYTVTGTPSGDGTASFAISIGGQSCTVDLTVAPAATPTYCTGGPTTIVDVVGAGGATWMDRNLGATQAATSSTDANAYGDLYQWGRFTDGHQCRTSGTSTTAATTVDPDLGNTWDGLFIINQPSPEYWTTTAQTALWQSDGDTNDPCPSGYRVPTETELNTERLAWSSNNAAGANASPLKLPVGGGRNSNTNGGFGSVGINGVYWSSTVSGTSTRTLSFNSSNALISSGNRADGFSVRCIKDTP